MKRSKAIKLVLVSGLLGAEGSSLAKAANNHLFYDSNSKKKFSSSVNKASYSSVRDSSKIGSGSSLFVQHIAVHRGGWGIFGHHATS